MFILMTELINASYYRQLSTDSKIKARRSILVLVFLFYYFWKIFYCIKRNRIFQFSSESVLIQRISIGFEAIKLKEFIRIVQNYLIGHIKLGGQFKYF